MKEYKVTWVGEPSADPKRVEARLNEEAAQGWKLVGLYQGRDAGYAVLGREATDETN